MVNINRGVAVFLANSQPAGNPKRLDNESGQLWKKLAALVLLVRDI
jgi:hypothetical protein